MISRRELFRRGGKAALALSVAQEPIIQGTSLGKTEVGKMAWKATYRAAILNDDWLQDPLDELASMPALRS